MKRPIETEPVADGDPVLLLMFAAVVVFAGSVVLAIALGLLR